MVDTDVWRRPAVKPDGEEYYEYVLCYVDDVLTISYDTDRVMKQIDEKLDFKDNKWNEADMYLGTKISKKNIEGTTLWTMSSHDYL